MCVCVYNRLTAGEFIYIHIYRSEHDVCIGLFTLFIDLTFEYQIIN